MLALTPLGAWPYGVARGFWLGLSIAVAFLALPRQSDAPYRILSLVSPSMMVCLFVGQSGVVLAGILLAGLRLVSIRPVLAGVFLSLLMLKPHLALVVPLALLFAARYKALAGFVAGGAGLALLSAALFGCDAWRAWFVFMQTSAGYLANDRGGELVLMMPTLTAAVRAMGGCLVLAHAVQCLGMALAVSAL